MTNLEINNAYIGTDQVEKIYLGQDLVYSSQPGPGPEPGYDTMYLTIEALEDGLLTINSSSSVTYSINEGAWETSPDAATLTLSTGDKVRFKGDENTVTSGLFKTSTISSNVYGNIMSLKYGDNFAGQTTVFDCSNMFNGYTGLRDASHLVLPATTLSSSCYQNMFIRCSNLTMAPSLPATTLASKCYYQMFYNCTSLTTAPALPATTLEPECYRGMFSSCSSLTVAPALPATTLANNCYQTMFYNCTSLTTAPVLPATTLTTSCYMSMFNECAGLTTAPELPATTLAGSCYRTMFRSCTNLNYIKCLATDISATNSTYNWVDSVSPTGTFVKAESMAAWTTGKSGIPDGWTVVDE